MRIKSIVSLIFLWSANATPALADPPNATIDRVPAPEKNVTEEKNWGETSLDTPELIRELQQGGYIIYLRHTATEQKTEQWYDIDLKDCSTQRNLSGLGRLQAQQIGKAFSLLEINVSKVLTSPFCRCIDTSRIAFGASEISHDLTFSIGGDETLEAALGKMLGTQPVTGSNTVLVSHSTNLRNTTDIDPKPEGVAVIFKPQEGGSYSYVATVYPESWEEMQNSK